MCPPRRSRRGGSTRGNANAQPELPKAVLQAGAGWTLENYQYLKTLPAEKQLDGLYKVFAIPLRYKNDETHAAVKVFIEFQMTSFTFAQQFNEPNKALMILMLLSDYIGNVHQFSSSKDSFANWVEKATKIIQNSDFTPNEQNVLTNYINSGLRNNAHVLHFILTNEAMQKLDAEGLQLFKPVSAGKKENTDDNDKDKDAQAELEAQLAAAALTEKKKAEAAQKEAEMIQAMDTIINENMNRIKAQLDQRTEQLLQHLYAAEEKIVGKPNRR